MRLSFSLVTLLLTGAGSLLAQQDPLTSLKDALRTDVAVQNAHAAGSSGNRLSAEQSALWALDRASTEDPLRAEDTLRQLLNTDLPDPLRAQVSAALQQIQQVRAARAKAFKDEVATVTQKAGAAVLKAQKASELDSVLEEMHRTSETGKRRNDSDANETRDRSDRALRFVQNWQDYLFDMERGKFGSAAQKMTNLAQGEEVLPGIGRSVLLDRMRIAEEADRNQSKGAVARALQNVHSLDDIPAAVAQLRGESYGGRSSEVQAAISALDPLYKSYSAYKNGWAATLPLSYVSGAEMDPVISKLRTDLFLRVLPRALGVEGKTEPVSGETIQQYLVRLRQVALKAGDYDLLGRTIAAMRDLSVNLSGQMDLSLGQDYSAFLSLHEAQNDERARRFADAVLSYRNALRMGSEAIPAEMIGERLSAIEKEQPEEYKRAMEMGQHDGRDGRFHGMPEPSRPPLSLPPVSPAPSPPPRPPVTVLPVSPSPAAAQTVPHR
jgi:hypothetical protein